MSPSSVRPRHDCPSFRPGHMTHWIQAKLSWTRYRDTARRPVVAVAVDDTGLLALTMPDGSVAHRWNHDPAFVRSRLAGPDRGEVRLAEPALLRIGTTLVSVCTIDEAQRCPTDVATGELSLADRLERLGGFDVPAAGDLRADGEP